MNTIIYENDPLIILPDIGEIMVSIVGDDYQVERVARISHTHGQHFHFTGSRIQLLPPLDDLVVSGCLSTLRLFKPGSYGLAFQVAKDQEEIQYKENS